MSKNQQRIRSAKQLGYQDGLSGEWGRWGRYRPSQWKVWWDYRSGYKRGQHERKYGKRKPKKSWVMTRGAEIVLDVAVGSILTILVAYVAGLIGK